MGSVCNRDHAGPALALARVIEYVDRPGRLHDSTMDAGEAAIKLRQIATHAALTQTAILWTVGAIDGADTGRWVLGTRLRSPRRRRPVGPAGAGAGHLVRATCRALP